MSKITGILRRFLMLILVVGMVAIVWHILYLKKTRYPSFRPAVQTWVCQTFELCSGRRADATEQEILTGLAFFPIALAVILIHALSMLPFLLCLMYLDRREDKRRRKTGLYARFQ